MTTHRSISKIVRQAIGLSGTPCPIEISDGVHAPSLKGKSYHWTTKTGKPVYYPSAYRRAFGNPIYVSSSRRIEVGAAWLSAALLADAVA